MVKNIVITAMAFGAILHIASADTTTVAFDSGSQTLFNQSNAVLSGGSSNDGNGDVLQLGYFTGANFTGSWVPLSGQGSANTAVISGSNDNETYNQTSIGDLNGNGAGDGTFAISLDFVSGNPTSGNNLPAANTQLAIRFYNGTTIAGSTFYNTVTDSLWKWQAPTTPPSVVTMSLDDTGLVWEGGSNSAFHTTIATAVPEPSTVASVLLGVGLLTMARPRRSRPS
jgi:hypothetical protein